MVLVPYHTIIPAAAGGYDGTGTAAGMVPAGGTMYHTILVVGMMIPAGTIPCQTSTHVSSSYLVVVIIMMIHSFV